MNLLYSPSQPEIVKKICAHMNEKERKRAYLFSFALGLVFFCIPAAVIFGLVLQALTVTQTALGIITLTIAAKLLINKQKHLNLNTGYAKEKGYTFEGIFKP